MTRRLLRLLAVVAVLTAAGLTLSACRDAPEEERRSGEPAGGADNPY